MKEPKIHGLPPLPEGHEFLLEGEKRREGMLVWSDAKTWEFPWRDPAEPLDQGAIYCAPIRKGYAERQAEWVAEHGIKVGSKVRVTRKGENMEDGWTNAWLPSMDGYVGTVCSVEDMHRNGVRLEEPDANFPYFVLEPVKDIAPGHNPAGVTVYDVGELYRLMTEDEVRNPARPFDGKCERWFPVQGWIGGGAWGGDSLSYTYRVRIPKQVPLTAEDWAGHGCWWVRMDGIAPMLVVCIHEDRLILAEGTRETYSSLFQHFERSRDLINWGPCSKPE